MYVFMQIGRECGTQVRIEKRDLLQSTLVHICLWLLFIAPGAYYLTGMLLFSPHVKLHD